jgi:hypothetical protein
MVVIACLRHSPPDLQVFHSVSVFIFRRTLPSYDVRSERGEAELEDVWCGERGDDMAERGVDDCDPEKVLEERFQAERGEAYSSGDAQAKYLLSGE